MFAKPPNPEQLLRRMLEPFDEMDPILSMTDKEIRADLAKDGYDVAAIDREARAFLGLPPKRKPRLPPSLLASIILPLTVIGSCIDVFGPAIPATLPLFAKASPSSADVPIVTAAAAAPPAVDGGVR